MFFIGICDDELSTCSMLETEIASICCQFGNRVDIEAFYSGRDLIKYLQQGHLMDLLFLDIMLPDIDGVEIGSIIRMMKCRTLQIAYISSDVGRTMELFAVRPMRFLVKPLGRMELVSTICDSYNYYLEDRQCFPVRNREGSFNIRFGDIIYFESDRKIVKVYTVDKLIYRYYGRLEDSLVRLPGSFSHIHKSYIINREHIKFNRAGQVTMTNEITLPVSRSRRSAFKRQLMADELRSAGRLTTGLDEPGNTEMLPSGRETR